MADRERAYLHSHFNQDDDYFTLHKKESKNVHIYCSAPFPGETGWESLGNDYFEVIE
jgi:hypothetical protein